MDGWMEFAAGNMYEGKGWKGLGMGMGMEGICRKWEEKATLFLCFYLARK